MRTYIRWVLAAAVVAGLVLCAGQAEVAAQGKAVKSDSVVKVAAKADKPGADGKQVVTITMDVENEWHIYANPVGTDNLTTSETQVTVDKVKREDVQVEFPQGKLVKDKDFGDYYTYEGNVTIKVTVPRAKDDTTPLKVSVKFTACSHKDKRCLPTAKVELTP